MALLCDFFDFLTVHSFVGGGKEKMNLRPMPSPLPRHGMKQAHPLPSPEAPIARRLRRLLFAVLGFSSLIAASGCVVPRNVAISSDPSGAMIQVDGQNVGVTPLTHDLDFRNSSRVIISAKMAGYHPEQLALDKEAQEVRDGHINLVLMEDEAWRVTTTSEATNSWLRLQIDSSLDSDAVWQKLIDSVTSRYANLEQLDVESGYIKTAPEMRRFQGSSGSYEVRTRFVCAMSSRKPLIYKVKIEADISDRGGRWALYDRVFKEDASLLEELQSRLGIK
jgi:hypothetical protein